MAGLGQPIGPASILGFERFDPALPFQAANRTVKRSRAQTRTAHRFDVVQHGVSVLGPVREACQNQELGVRKMSRRIAQRYAPRTTYHVVVSE